MKIGLAQINTRVGAIDANTRKVLDYAERARNLGCGLVLFPELTLCGYPPEDLLLHRGLRSRVEAAFARVRDETHAAFPGFNRAQAAVIEGAVLVSRLHMLAREKIDAEVEYLRIAIDKTAGESEREAWGWLMTAVAKQREAAAGTKGKA